MQFIDEVSGTATTLGKLRSAAMVTVSLVALSAAIPGMAQAQTQPTTTAQSDSLQIEEIIVTAQKRAENLQTTPVAITAVTGASLERRGVTDISGVARIAPNVVFNTTAPVSGVSSGAIVFIRGIGQSDFQLTTEPGVGTYVDGVYASRSVGGVLDVLDLERVEVLRGPQGTLFGRNTIGGAISMTTRAPSSEFGGKIAATIGEANRLDLRASIDLPLSERVRTNLAFSSKTRDGYVSGRLDNRSLGDENRQTVRGVVVFDVTDSFKATFTADASRIREQNAADKLVGITLTAPGAATSTEYVYNRHTGKVDTRTVAVTPGNPSLAWLYNAVDAPGSNIPGYGAVPYDGRWITSDLGSTFATGANGTELDVWGASGTLSWDVPLGTIKSISAYRHTQGAFNRDADGSPLTVTQGQNRDYMQEQFSEELQWVGDAFNKRLLWATGLYYFDESGHDLLTVSPPPAFGVVENDAYVKNKSYAAYGQGTFRATDALSLTLGARYTKDKKGYSVPAGGGSVTNGAAGIFGPPGTVTPFFAPGSYNADYDNTSFKVILDYKLAEGAFAYASYSEGFKSGGFNTRYLAPVGQAVAFDPELLKSYEAGVKLELFDRRVRANAAVFHSKYDDIQLVVYNSGAPLTKNGGAAEINGVELELNAKVTRGLDVNFGGGYLDAEYTRVNPLDPAITLSQQVTLDSKLPKTPKWTMNGSAEYRHDAPFGDGQLVARGDWSYSASVYNDATNSPFIYQGAYNLFNASVSYEAPESAWSITAGVQNLTNKRIITSGDSNYSIGFHEANFNRPREWLVTLKAQF